MSPFKKGYIIMKEIKLVAGKKTYIKDKLTVNDWLDILDIAEKTSKDKIDSKALTNQRIKFIAKTFGISIEEINSECDFADIMNAYREIDLELTSAFLGTPLKRTATGGVEIVEEQ